MAIKTFARGLAEATAEFLEDSTLGSPLPNYAYNEKKADEAKANLAEKITATPGEIGAATVDFPLTIATGVIETSTIGEPLPYYGRDAAKGNMAGENIVGTTVWAGTFTGYDIKCRRGSHYTESVHICRGDRDGVVANRYDDIYYVGSE